MLSPYLNGTGLISNKNQVLILLGNMTRLLDLFAFVGNIEFGCAQIVGLENGHFFLKIVGTDQMQIDIVLFIYSSFEAMLSVSTMRRTTLISITTVMSRCLVVQRFGMLWELPQNLI